MEVTCQKGDNKLIAKGGNKDIAKGGNRELIFHKFS